ncbi:MAG: SpoIIE family protein phosphatase [Nitrosomonadales bacterium]|nr:SpoIIE family protein phosphatase [Nitrosomonadales bacterium]
MRINLPVTDIERLVPEGEVLVSRTNLKGVITYCNRPFCEISGYSEGELLGAPHNLIRHPDVPAEVFADCWKSIQSGKPWNRVIKNRCKNGDYYWVEANISPWIADSEMVGYVSLRYKPMDAQVAAAEHCYQALRAGIPAAETIVKSSLDFIVESQQRLAEKIMALEKYRDSSEEELRIGSDIMMRISNMNSTLDSLVRHKISPAFYYSGDMILAARTPGDVLHILLADAVGHGLTAAMNVLPLSQAFYAMTKKGFGIARIVEELNQKIHKFMPVDRFVSATLISVNLRNQAIEVWNGGNPAPVLIGADGDILRKWPSSNLPLGILGKRDFSSGTEAFQYKQDCQLFLFSDGLPEAESPYGVQFGTERIDVFLEHAPPQGRFDELLDGLERHLCGQPAHDDISLAMISMPVAESSDELMHRGSPKALDSDWRLAISLGADELKYVEVIPLLTQVIAQIHATRDHHSALLLILSELFNNALDHGVLHLDSAIKQGADGFEQFLLLREERLRALDTGNIDIEIEKVVIEDMYGVKIRVADSGKGFDYAAIQGGGQVEQYGRGIALVKGLAYKLEFAQRGSEAIAYYVCK